MAGSSIGPYGEGFRAEASATQRAGDAESRHK